MRIAFKPLLRLGLTFAIVAFYHGLTASFLSGITRFAFIVVLSIATWIVVSRALFGGEAGLEPFDRFGRE